MSRWIFAALVLLIVQAPVVRGAEIEFDGQLRVRAEGADRSHRGKEVNWDILQRTRVGVRAVVSEEVDLYVQVQDSRNYGREPGTLASTSNVDLHQGWAEVRKSRGEAEAQMRVGRQVLAYGTERIIGAVEWNNVGRAFDGARLRVARRNWNFDLGAWRLTDLVLIQPPQDEPPVDSSDELFVSYNSYRSSEGDRRGEFYAIYRDDDRGYYETTLGEHVDGRIGKIRFDQEFAFQTGSRLGEDLEAYLISAQAHVRVADPLEIGAGFDFLSGDKMPGDGKFNYFDNRRLFATLHKFYGLMDSSLFLAGTSGLVDPYGRIGLKGPRDLGAAITVHVFFTHHEFWPEGDPIDPPAPLTDELYLGTEVDGTLAFAVASRTRLELGGAVLVPGGSLKNRVDELGANRGLDRTAFWAYAQGIASF